MAAISDMFHFSQRRKLPALGYEATKKSFRWNIVQRNADISYININRYLMGRLK